MNEEIFAKRLRNLSLVDESRIMRAETKKQRQKERKRSKIVNFLSERSSNFFVIIGYNFNNQFQDAGKNAK